ncbi:UNVERIFIED_CONTAM: hypothetical protein GTU68_002339 [Idotea baltica]|nr:hypothetical protein [Idotea baltica]
MSFVQIKNDLILRVLAGEHVERHPVWLMRQAGRILPEYRKIRGEVDGFKALVKNPDLAAEVTIQPVDILKVDAAIIFSDILVIPEAMGLSYDLVEKVGPRFPKVIQSRQDIQRLGSGPSAADDLGYVYKALEATKRGLQGRVPLIGFAGAPFTLLAYMLEGGGSKTFSKAKRFLYSDPESAHLLLEKLTATTIAYLKNKIRSGANVIQVFDSWAGILDQRLYREFSLRYIREICEAITEVPVITFAKGAWFCHEDLASLPCAGIGLDWQTNPRLARELYGPTRVLQGNLDPSCLLSNTATITQETKKMLETFGMHHIANLGHGVYPDTPVSHVQAFISAVKTFKPSTT